MLRGRRDACHKRYIGGYVGNGQLFHPAAASNMSRWLIRARGLRGHTRHNNCTRQQSSAGGYPRNA
eukprot:11659831-Alexandrium_andersonii.AAC.1